MAYTSRLDTWWASATRWSWTFNWSGHMYNVFRKHRKPLPVSRLWPRLCFAVPVLLNRPAPWSWAPSCPGGLYHLPLLFFPTLLNPHRNGMENSSRKRCFQVLVFVCSLAMTVEVVHVLCQGHRDSWCSTHQGLTLSTSTTAIAIVSNTLNDGATAATIVSSDLCSPPNSIHFRLLRYLSWINSTG